MTVVASDHHVRVRFAPAPTGHLHVGGLRAALFNWLFARHHKGSFLVRIEDTDIERSRLEYVESICQSLSWAGLEPDEPVVVQSQRTKQHKELIDKLLHAQRAYRCYCTQQEFIDRCGRDASSNSDEQLFISYDGYCRQLMNEPVQDKPYVVRFLFPDISYVSFHDLIRGEISFTRDQFDDFIISRSDGRPVYNFVVVADDSFMRVTHVIRGEDHIANTPKQIMLYQALEFAVPQFAHLPMVLGPSGDKLSKRDGAVAVLDYQREGYLPDAFINYLARLGWSFGDQEVFTKDEMIAHFQLKDVGKKGAIFDVQKLAWLNGVYIRAMSNDALLSYMQQYIEPDILKKTQWNKDRANIAIGLYKERVQTVRELADALCVIAYGSSFDRQQVAEYAQQYDAIISVLRCVIDALEVIQDTDSFAEDAKKKIKEIAKQHAVGLAQVVRPIRYALIGSDQGPSVFDLLDIIGQKQVVQRLESLYKVLIAVVP